MKHKHPRATPAWMALLLAAAALVSGSAPALAGPDMGKLTPTKIFLDQSLPGFGGGKGDNDQAKLEASAAYLLTRKLVAGVEYRMKPHKVGVDDEKAYSDLFMA